MSLPLILASSSPRRRQLLAALGLDFSVETAGIDESALPAEAPEAHARRLAETKAQVIAQQHPKAVVLAADTIVVYHDQIMGKPVDAGDAWRMLIALRESPHQVISAVAVAHDGFLRSAIHANHVLMRDYSDAEITAYIASGDPFDKAGAYAIQHPDFAPVAQFDGCPASIMGLPLALTAPLLQAAGVEATLDWPAVCHTITGRCCQLMER